MSDRAIGEEFPFCFDPWCKIHGRRRDQCVGATCNAPDGTDACGQRLYIPCECVCHRVRGFATHADLLAACEQVVREVECHCADYPRSPVGSCPHCVCRAAVAKAQGEA